MKTYVDGNFLRFVVRMLGVLLVLMTETYLVGCAIDKPETKNDKMDRFLCEADLCESFARSHDYTLLKTKINGESCECWLLSPHMPDAFIISLPKHK